MARTVVVYRCANRACYDFGKVIESTARPTCISCQRPMQKVR